MTPRLPDARSHGRTPQRTPSRRVSARHRDQTGDVQSSFTIELCAIVGSILVGVLVAIIWMAMTGQVFAPDLSS